MAGSLNPQQLQQVNAALTAHPEILQAFKTYQDWQSHRGRMAYATTGGPPTPQQVLAKYGLNVPDISDYQVQVDPQGQVNLKRLNWFQRNEDWILPVATIGTAGALDAASAGGAASSGGSAADAAAPAVTSGDAGPLAADETFTAGPIAGTGLSGVDTTGMVSTAATGTGFGAALKAALPTIIGAGASLGGAAIAAKGNTDAAKIAAQQQQAALDQAKLIYQQQRADLSPYRQIGTSALGPLSFGLGIAAPTPTQGPFDTSTGPQGTTVGTPAATGPIVAAGAKDAQGNPLPGAGQNQVIPNAPTYAQTHAATLNTIGTSANIRDPQTGLVHVVPHDQVGAAMQNGGVLVS